MSCKDKHCHPYPIEPAPFAPGSCDPHPPCPPRPPRPPMPCAPCPPSQYIGSRYVPIFADPIEWDIHRSYESLTIVTHDGESYTSKCNVAPGVDITNTRYWAKTGAYNAQVEQYKNEVKDLSSQVSGFASDNAEFRDKIDQFTTDNAEMKNTVAEDKARVDALAERVATAETEIDGLQATTAQHTTELANLHAKDEDLQRQITSNDNDIAALQAKDVEHDSRLNGIDTKLRSHDATLAQNTADIAKNTKNIQDNAVAIAQNAHELADHAEQLADHEARLTSQHQEITANHQAIERNTSDIASLRADLTEDEAKIESNRDAIAHINDSLTGYVTNETYTAGQAAQDTRITNTQAAADKANANIGEWETDHPGQTISDFAVGITNSFESTDAKAEANANTIGAWTENHPGKTISEVASENASKDAAQDELLNKLKTEKADKTAIPDVSGFVTQTTYDAGQAAQDRRLDKLEAIKKATVDRIGLRFVPLTDGAEAVHKMYISPVPLTADNAPGCYTLRADVGNCDYYYADSTGVHVSPEVVKGVEVLDSNVIQVSFEYHSGSKIGTGFPLGYGLTAVSPTIILNLVK